MNTDNKEEILKIIANVEAASGSSSIVIFCPEKYKDEYTETFGSDTVRVLQNSQLINNELCDDKVIIMPTYDKPIKFIVEEECDIDFEFPKTYGTWNCINDQVESE